jgi:hypothetical protein
MADGSEEDKRVKAADSDLAAARPRGRLDQRGDFSPSRAGGICPVNQFIPLSRLKQ